MKYFKASESGDENIIGDFPQLHCTTQAYAHALSAWEFPSFTPQLEFEIENKAKLTDVLSSGAISAFGFLMNAKTKEIFSGMQLMEHKYFDANVLYKKRKQNLEYFWLHLCQPDLVHQIDYKKSVFYELEWDDRVAPIQIESFDHYQQLKAKDEDATFGVELEKIHLSKDFDKNLDVFALLPFAEDVFLSERLVDKLYALNISGFDLQEYKEIHF